MAQHQKVAVKQIVPGWCGGTCAKAECARNARPAAANARIAFDLFDNAMRAPKPRFALAGQLADL
ncbi:hypothetical protein QV13_04475 [Mesorhizobium hungaricum]|uniref:Uncharacterized protein n=1 Tax=Mesorhizobium hungaricum TaxID=1566387 RepID=A0A1C2E8Z6_9HYPH|nr:hypothetical protein QV13_04475 [Mesorhizobium hungaricum]